MYPSTFIIIALRIINSGKFDFYVGLLMLHHEKLPLDENHQNFTAERFSRLYIYIRLLLAKEKQNYREAIWMNSNDIQYNWT